MTATNNKMEPGFWAGVIIICLLLFLSKCHLHAQTAQLDTIMCKVECITKYVTRSTGKTTRIYAVYKDARAGIEDIIPVSKTVYEYIVTCSDNGIKPSLGIRLRNGQISSIVKFKRKFNENTKSRPIVYDKWGSLSSSEAYRPL